MELITSDNNTILKTCLPNLRRASLNYKSLYFTQTSFVSHVLTITDRISSDNKVQQSCVMKENQPKQFLLLKAKRNDGYEGENINLIEPLSIMI